MLLIALLLENKTYLLYYRIATIIWATIIIVGSFLPGKDLPEVSLFQADKIVHLIFYAVFSFLLLKSFATKSSKYLIVFIFCFVFGLLIEIFQPITTPDRRFDVFDIVANILGSLMPIIFLKK